MKLLLDANLSWRLISKLMNHFVEVVHADKIPSLKFPAKDMEIWQYAQKNGLTIVTNDEDFLNLLLSKGFPPKIILLRVGNQSTGAIADLLMDRKQEIENLLKSENIGVLQIY